MPAFKFHKLAEGETDVERCSKQQRELGSSYPSGFSTFNGIGILITSLTVCMYTF